MNLINKINKIFNCILNPKFIVAYIKLICPLFELKDAIKNIKEIKNIIDVGSNKGQFALLARIYYPSCKIYSFEPQKKYLKIQKSILKKKIFFYNYCLGDRNYSHNLNITEKEDSSSLLSPKIFKDGIYKVKKRIKVKVKTLDTVLANQKLDSSLMKIDVQGFEYEVLLGALKSLKKIKYLIIEISSQDIYNNQTNKKKLLLFLDKNNFKLSKIYNKSKLSKNIFQCDYFFKNTIL
jgi:FkbM family methyltransferase